MTAVLRTCPGAGTAEINSKRNRLSGSQLPQANFPHTILGKNKDPNLHHRTRSSASLITAGKSIKMKTRNQVPSIPSEHPQEATNRKAREPEERERPYTVGGKARGQHPVEWTVSECPQIHYQERLSLGSEIPRSREIHRSKRRTPASTAALLTKSSQAD